LFDKLSDSQLFKEYPISYTME